MTAQGFVTRMAAKRICYVGHSVSPDALFPLTPALSLGEWEQRRQFLDISPSAGLADSLASVLPLPEGEGWGEGEEHVRPVRAADASKLAFRR